MSRPTFPREPARHAMAVEGREECGGKGRRSGERYDEGAEGKREAETREVRSKPGERREGGRNKRTRTRGGDGAD